MSALQKLYMGIEMPKKHFKFLKNTYFPHVEKHIGPLRQNILPKMILQNVILLLLAQSE